MNQHQATAIRNHCRFGFETMHPRFAYRDGDWHVVLSVNSGYE